MFFRSLVNWIKRAAINTAFAELAADLEAGGAVATDPPLLTLDVESTLAEPQKAPAKATRRKAPAKK